MITGWKFVEATELHTGLAVQLLDDHTGLPIETAAEVTVELPDGTGWREVALEPVVLPGAVFYYPKVERYGDSRGRPSRSYRVSARSEYYVALGAVVVAVAPWDDVRGPASSPTAPTSLRMVPRPSAPFGTTPTLRGRVQTLGPIVVGIEGAIVAYDQPQPSGPPRTLHVLSEDDGDYALPIRRIATPGLTVSVTLGAAPPVPFPFNPPSNPWRTAVRTTQNLSL